MPKLIFLGTATNVPDEKHENSHMVLVGEERTVLIDGPGSPYLRLRKAGVSDEQLTDLILTHFHPDHVSGVPTLIMSMGLTNRKKHLDIYANQHCTLFIKQMLDNYEWDTWHFFPVTFHVLPDDELHTALDTDEFKILSSPVKHFIPTSGLRIEFKKSGKVLAYSCDTAPTPSLIPLAKDADVFIHEAAGASVGHSSALQAGEMAKEAGAKELYLIHYPVNGYPYHELIDEAAKAFSGKITMAEDFMELEF